MTNQLMFHSTAVQSVNHNNQIWITSSELSKLLEYSDSKSVTKIYSRNADEFTDKMTMVVKMTTNGINNSLREKSVRIFSLRGAHLVAMFANTGVAKEVRKWLLDLADKEIGISSGQQMININLEQQLLTIQEYYCRVFNLYYDCLADFLKKNSPHIHYNFYTALDKIHINVNLSLNSLRRELNAKSKIGN